MLIVIGLACEKGPLPPYPGPRLTLLSARADICRGESIEIGAVPFTGYTYTWQPQEGLTDPRSPVTSASPSTTTTYTLRASDARTGLAAEARIEVIVHPIPIAQAGMDMTACSLKLPVRIGAAGDPYYAYTWSPSAGLSDTSSAQPLASPTQSTTYTLTVADPVVSGCSSTSTVSIKVLPGGLGWELLSFTDCTNTTQPSCRASTSAVLDPKERKAMLFGGFSGTTLSDLWALGLSVTPPAWAPLSPAGALPTPRQGHSGVLDETGNRMVIFGGFSPPTTYYNDLWALGLSVTPPAWAPLSPAGALPTPRQGHSAIYHPPSRRMILFGGLGSAGLLNDLWALDLSATPPSWSQLIPSGFSPTARTNASGVYDDAGDRMLIFGGFSGTALNDLWALDLSMTPPAWTPLSPPGPLPPPRQGHMAIFDSLNKALLVFGGFASPTYYNDLWALSVTMPTLPWTMLMNNGATGSPPWRSNMAGFYDPVEQRLLIFGGAPFPFTNDIWALSACY